MKRCICLGLVFLGIVLPVSGQNTPYTAITPDLFDWRDSPVADGVRSAQLLGDARRAELYTSVGEIAAGTVFPGHSHPDDRLSIVVSGTMYFGAGDDPDAVTYTPYPAGSVIFTPAGTPHFMWAKDGPIVVQEVGYGPSGVRFLDESLNP